MFLVMEVAYLALKLWQQQTKFLLSSEDTFEMGLS